MLGLRLTFFMWAVSSILPIMWNWNFIMALWRSVSIGYPVFCKPSTICWSSSQMKGLSADDGTPMPLVSCFLMALIRLLMTFDFVGFPVCVCSFHSECYCMKNEIPFFQKPTVEDRICAGSSSSGSSVPKTLLQK